MPIEQCVCCSQNLQLLIDLDFLKCTSVCSSRFCSKIVLSAHCSHLCLWRFIAETSSRTSACSFYIASPLGGSLCGGRERRPFDFRDDETTGPGAQWRVDTLYQAVLKGDPWFSILSWSSIAWIILDIQCTPSYNW